MTWNPMQGEINATCLQVRRAYEAHFGVPMPPEVPYSDVVRNLVILLGVSNAKALIEGQSNDPDAPEPNVEENQ